MPDKIKTMTVENCTRLAIPKFYLRVKRVGFNNVIYKTLLLESYYTDYNYTVYIDTDDHKLAIISN